MKYSIFIAKKDTVYNKFEEKKNLTGRFWTWACTSTHFEILYIFRYFLGQSKEKIIEKSCRPNDFDEFNKIAGNAIRYNL